MIMDTCTFTCLRLLGEASAGPHGTQQLDSVFLKLTCGISTSIMVLLSGNIEKATPPSGALSHSSGIKKQGRPGLKLQTQNQKAWTQMSELYLQGLYYFN